MFLTILNFLGQVDNRWVDFITIKDYFKLTYIFYQVVLVLAVIRFKTKEEYFERSKIPKFTSIVNDISNRNMVIIGHLVLPECYNGNKTWTTIICLLWRGAWRTANFVQTEGSHIN